MNLSIDLAQDALQHPSSDLKILLNDPRVPKDVMDSLKSDGFKPEDDRSEVAARVTQGVNGLGDGRLQVVNEKQEFR